jgi:hypothetical protein
MTERPFRGAVSRKIMTERPFRGAVSRGAFWTKS